MDESDEAEFANDRVRWDRACERTPGRWTPEPEKQAAAEDEEATPEPIDSVEATPPRRKRSRSRERDAAPPV